jgi:YHS domain-containing protein
MKIISSLIGAIALLILSVTASFAESELNVTSTGLAMRGVDPVSYFASGAPAPGDFKITAVHNGATYRFATEENKVAFSAAPEKYLPQYGGYCAMGVKMGKKLDGDPSVFSIIDGKLYLNVALAVADMWRPDAAANIKAADETWAKIQDKNPGTL